MSEKIGGAKGTELDDEFLEMERVSKDHLVQIMCHSRLPCCLNCQYSWHHTKFLAAHSKCFNL